MIFFFCERATEKSVALSFLRQNRREKNILFYEEERVRPKRTIPLYFLEEILCWRTDLRPT